jgi:hypothetical protein
MLTLPADDDESVAPPEGHKGGHKGGASSKRTDGDDEGWIVVMR